MASSKNSSSGKRDNRQHDALRRLSDLIDSQHRWQRWDITNRIIKSAVLIIAVVAAVALFSFGGPQRTQGAAYPDFQQIQHLFDPYYSPDSRKDHIALVKLHKNIDENEDSWAGKFVSGFERAFASTKTRCVILSVDTVGGSTVDYGLLYKRIRNIRGLYPDKPLITLVEERALGNAYLPAVAADEIVAFPDSLVGNFGVAQVGFGYVELLKTLRIERRVYSSGKNKAFLDPFQEEKSSEINNIKTILNDIKRQLSDIIHEGRGDRLTGEDSLLFSGLQWSGQQALQLGLVDRLGDRQSIAAEFGNLPIVDYTHRRLPLNSFAEWVVDRLNDSTQLD